MTGKTKEEVAAEAATWVGWGTFKPLLADAIVAHLEPIQARYTEISQSVTHYHTPSRELMAHPHTLALNATLTLALALAHPHPHFEPHPGEI